MTFTRIRVRLTPRGGRDEIERLGDDGVLHARVSAPPAKGAANQALVRLLATKLGIASSQVRIATGAQSRLKTVAVEGLTSDEVHRRLGG